MSDSIHPVCDICMINGRNVIKCYAGCSFNTCLECFFIMDDEADDDVYCPQCKQGFREYIYPGDTDKTFRGNMENHLPNDPEGKIFCLNDYVFCFSGPVKNGKVDGPGNIETNDNLYAEDVVFDSEERIVGEISLYDEPGNIVFRGFYNEGKRTSGTFYFQDGRKYIGTFKDHKRDGYGTMYGPDTMMIYSGEWSEGKRHGQGVEYNSNGTEVYRGEYLQDVRHGNGKLYRDKSVLKFEGVVKNNEPESGLYYDASGCLLFIEKNDNCSYTIKNSNDVIVFTGCMTFDLKRIGIGMECSDTGDAAFIGTFDDNDKRQYGTEYIDKSIYYVGAYHDGIRNDSNARFYNLETKDLEFYGSVCNDVKHGTGVIYLDKDTKISCIFVNGVPHGDAMLSYSTESATFVCNHGRVNLINHGNSSTIPDTDLYVLDDLENVVDYIIQSQT